MEKFTYRPKPVSFSNGADEAISAMTVNQEELERMDRAAAEAGQLVGRYIQEPYADSYAVYQIVKENKKTVRIRVCSGLGDDWVIPYWGPEAAVQKSYARKSIGRRDYWAELVAKKKKKT